MKTSLFYQEAKRRTNERLHVFNTVILWVMIVATAAMISSLTFGQGRTVFLSAGVVGAVASVIWFIVNQVYQLKEYDKLVEQTTIPNDEKSSIYARER